MPSYDEEAVRRRVEEEVDTLSDYELRLFRRSQSSFEAWIYRIARAIGRLLSAPIRWIEATIRGLLKGFFEWLS